MSRILSAKELCERALRVIGAFPVTQSAADSEQLRETMFWLDLVLAEFSGSGRLFWQVPDTISIQIVNGTQNYALKETLGAEYPDNGMQFPIEAWLEDADGNRSDLEIVTRHKFEDVSKVDETGQPCHIYIDRLADPTMRIFPVPRADDTTVWTLKLVIQTFAPDVSPSGVTGNQPNNETVTEIRQAWQRWVIWQLSHDIGSGPVYTLPDSRISKLKASAEDAKRALLAYENREHQSTPPITEAWGA